MQYPRCPRCNRKQVKGPVEGPHSHELICRLCASAERDNRPAPRWWDELDDKYPTRAS